MTVIPFSRGPERSPRSSPPPEGHSAAIVFFTGVRFERHAEISSDDRPDEATPAQTAPIKARRVPARRPRKA